MWTVNKSPIVKLKQFLSSENLYVKKIDNCFIYHKIEHRCILLRQKSITIEFYLLKHFLSFTFND